MPPQPHIDKVEPEQWSQEVRSNFWARLFISSLILIACLYVILSQAFPPDYTKWAMSTIGVVLGYWLHDVAKR